jgi:hypothetical protein
MMSAWHVSDAEPRMIGCKLIGVHTCLFFVSRAANPADISLSKLAQDRIVVWVRDVLAAHAAFRGIDI